MDLLYPNAAQTATEKQREEVLFQPRRGDSIITNLSPTVLNPEGVTLSHLQFDGYKKEP
jgi:hypothetical protein